MIFKKNKQTTDTTPQVIEVKLNKDYKFMYDNFLISSQHDLYLVLQGHGGQVDALKFNFRVYKFGYPNDEAMGTHPLAKFGLGSYGLFQVLNSPWTKEICEGNRIHPRHHDSMFENLKHYVARFKDVTLDILCNNMEEMQLPKEKVIELVNQELEFLTTDD
ncbi:MAG: hypothetical protein JNK18_08030 [Cyclobacteriaceae bacterium]|nr:hypothetical protein [Cyclobacteriaceae bacterium]